MKTTLETVGPSHYRVRTVAADGAEHTFAFGKLRDAESYAAAAEKSESVDAAVRLVRAAETPADPASPQQISYLRDLIARHGIPEDLEGSVPIPRIDHTLDRQTASWLLGYYTR